MWVCVCVCGVRVLSWDGRLIETFTALCAEQPTAVFSQRRELGVLRFKMFDVVLSVIGTPNH